MAPLDAMGEDDKTFPDATHKTAINYNFRALCRMLVQQRTSMLHGALVGLTLHLEAHSGRMKGQ